MKGQRTHPGTSPLMKLPLTPARLAANRRNAKKSTGPRTPDGKARVARNALKHGLAAARFTLMPELGESPEEFAAHRTTLLADLAPRTPQETHLAERIAIGYWLLHRTWRFEAASINRARADQKSEIKNRQFKPIPHSEIPDPQSPHEIILPPSPDFESLLRHQGAITADIDRATRQLFDLRRPRRAPSRQPASAGATTVDRSRRVAIDVKPSGGVAIAVDRHAASPPKLPNTLPAPGSQPLALSDFSLHHTHRASRTACPPLSVPPQSLIRTYAATFAPTLPTQRQSPPLLLTVSRIQNKPTVGAVRFARCTLRWPVTTPRGPPSTSATGI